MEYNTANVLILFAIISSVAVTSSSIEEIKQAAASKSRSQAILDTLSRRVCPPFGSSKFEVQTLQTMSQMFGCAYMESLQSTGTLFHLWLERPDNTSGDGHCGNTQHMDHFFFECLSKHDVPTDKDQSKMGWQHISLLEHTAESMLNKSNTRTYRCALYDVEDQDNAINMIRSMRLVISKPVIGEKFDVSLCNGLTDFLTRDDLPNVPEGHRYWPDGSLFLYLLGLKTTLFYTTTKTPEFPVTYPPTTTTRRPTNIIMTTSAPTTTTEEFQYVDYFFHNYFLYNMRR